jgi:pyrroline-5-carboxylate reductase
MANELRIQRLAVIGAGKMGEALIASLVGSGVVTPESVVATAAHRERLDRVKRLYRVSTTLDNRQAAEGAEVILLCVKPQVAAGVLEEMRPALGKETVLLSIVAGLDTAGIERHLDEGTPVVRAMPNTPSRIGHGMTAVCGGRWARGEQVELGRALFAKIGRSLVLDEKYFDAVTGLSASGPAFIYIVIESMAEGGVKCGLPRNVATELAAQACLGAAEMVLETGDHPALLKDEVTTPAGCTMDGILQLEEGGLRVTLIKAIVEARKRAQGLVDG